MIFHIDLDAFFAAVEQRDNPQFRDKPILVGRTDPQGKRCHRGVVTTCSYETRQYGVSSGMPIFQALELCPKAIIVEGHFEKYDEASRKMYEIFEHYTSQIEPVGIDEAYLSFYGFEEFYNYDLISVAKRIKNEIKGEIDISASIGIAQNKFVAKMASGYQKPDGLTFIKAGKEKEFLAQFEIRKLYGIGPALEEKLLKLGIKTVLDLQKRDLGFLLNLFGKYGEVLWCFSNGLDTRGVSSFHLAKSVGRSLTLPFNSNDPKYLKATLFYLCQKIAKELHEENLEGQCITTVVRYTDFTTKSHQKILPSPIYSLWEIYHIASNLLDEFWTGKPLRLIGARVSHFEDKKQLNFNFYKEEKLRKMEAAMERVREKFGFWSIYPASLTTIIPSILT